MSVVANVAINVDSRGAVDKLRQVQAQSQATERAVGGLGGAIGKLAIAAAALQAGKFIFAKTAELESQSKSLQVLTGSAEKAAKIISELRQLGAATPFTSSELIDSAKRLQAFGVETNKVVETTRRLADVSGATSAELQGLVTAYGQVQAKGRLQGEELLQFQERGVALQEELRKMYGLSGEELQKALSKGRISAEAVEVAIIRLTDAGGKYANGAIAQSDTLTGKFSTLVDGIENIAIKVGEVLKPALKEILNLGIAVVDQINNALAGPDYKKANDRLFNINARMEELRANIKAAEKAGITNLQIGPQIQGIDGQILGGGQPALPGLRFELQQLQKEATQLKQRLNQLRVLKAGGGKQSKETPATPPLLAEEPPKPRQLSVNDLLGGDIERKLRERQAQLEVATAREMSKAAGSPNAEQAMRMVEFASKLLGIKYQINAVDKTLSEREKVRDQVIGSQVDKANAAYVFDEGTLDLKTKRLELEREIDKLSLDQLSRAEEQYRRQQQAIDEALSGLGMEIIKLQAKTDAEKQALEYFEIENRLKKAGVELSEADKEAIRKKIAEIQKLTQEQQAANNRASELNDLYQGVADQIAGGIGGAIDSIANGVTNLGDTLKGLGKDILAAVGKMLIFYALAQALGALGGNDGKGVFSFLAKGFGFKGAKDGAYWSGGFDAFADGGVVTKPTMGLIGEGGEPEYVIPASKMRSAMGRYAAGARGSSVIPSSGGDSAAAGGGVSTLAPIDVRYTVERINNVDYVTADQFQAGLQQAAAQGARRGEQRTLATLRQNTAQRKRVGI